MPEVAELFIPVRLDTTQFKRDLQSLDNLGGDIGGKFSRNFSGTIQTGMRQNSSAIGGVFTGIFQGIGQQMVSIIGGAVSQTVGSIKGLGQEIFRVGAANEATAMTFGTLLGSAEKASAVLKEIKDFAANTPFELPEVTEAGKKLVALGVDAKNLIPTLTNVGNVASGLDIPFGELADIYGKIKVQNRLFAEDINQLQGRGIPIVGELAKMYGVNEAAIKKMVEEGKIGFTDIEKAFARMSGEGGKFNGLMDKLATTTGGKMSNLKDQIGQSFVAIFESVKPAVDATFDAIAAGFKTVKLDLSAVNGVAVEFSNYLKQNPAIVQSIAQGLSQAVQGAIQGAVNLARELVEFFVENRTEITALAQAVGSLLNIALKTSVALITGFLTILKENPGILRAINAVLGLVNANVERLEGEMKLVAAVGRAIGTTWNQIVGTIGNTIKRATDLGQTITKSILNTLTAVVTKVNNVESAFNKVGIKIRQAIGGALDWVKTKIREVTDMVAGIGSAIGNAVSGLGGMIGVGQGGPGVDAGKYTVRNPNGSLARSLAGSTHHHDYQQTRRGLTKDLTIFKNGSASVPVPSPASGTVSHAGPMGAYGNAVVVKLPGGGEALIGHLASTHVRTGQQIQRGQSLGIQGSTGRSSGIHIHIEAPANIVKDYYNRLNSGEWAAPGKGGPTLKQLKASDMTVPTITGTKTSPKPPALGSNFGVTKNLGNLTAHQGFGDFDIENIQTAKKSLEQFLDTHRDKTQIAQKVEDAFAERRRAIFDEWRDQHSIQQQFDNAAKEARQESLNNWLSGERQKLSFEQQYQAAAKANETARLDQIRLEEEAQQRLIEMQREYQAAADESWHKAHTLHKEIIDGVGGAISDSLKAAITGTKSLGEIALDLLGNIASKLADLAINSIMGSAGGGTGILGGLFSGIFGGPPKVSMPAFTGISNAFLPIPGLAKGGYVNQPTLAVIGEGGQGEYVIPENKMAAMTSSPTVNIVVNNTGSGQMSNQQVESLGRQVKHIVESTLIDHKRAGGLLS